MKSQDAVWLQEFLDTFVVFREKNQSNDLILQNKKRFQQIWTLIHKWANHIEWGAWYLFDSRVLKSS